MKYTVKEVLQFIEGNDVRFVRLVFFDIFGRRKNLLIMAGELKPAFEKGVPIPADAVCGAGHSGELLLVPEPDTLRMQNRLLSQGAAVCLLCSLRQCDGTYFDGDIRRLLRQTAERIRSAGLGVYFSLSCDFTLFRTDSEGNPTDIPDDRAGYYDTYPDDRGESVVRRLCLSLEEMEIVPLLCYHSTDNGQHTVKLKYTEPMKAADDFYTFVSTAMACASESGLYASFADNKLSGSSVNRLIISIALREAGDNLFTDKGQGISKKGQDFISGIIDHAPEMTGLFSQRTDTAEKRFDLSFRGDDSVIYMSMPESSRARLELRCSDASCNVYSALTMLINAGLEGIEKGIRIP